MGDRPTIVVAGAGIGGLTAALTIARAGFRVVVAERSAELTEIGAGIQLSPNAAVVLNALGLETALAKVSTEPSEIAIRSGVTGDTLATLPAGAFANRYGAPYRVVRRVDLQAVLLEAVRRNDDITLVLGTTVDDALPRAGALLVRIGRDDGGESISAVGLIGADGVWSGLRRQISGANAARFAGRTAWRTVIPIEDAPSFLRPEAVGLWLGPQAHLVHYPIAKGAAVNVVAIVEDADDRPGWDTDADRHLIAERFRDWCPEVKAVAGASSPWRKFSLNTVDPTGRWVEGRTALLGDAAHAMVPFLAQGAAMAIEDAAVLGRALAAWPGDVPAALAAYEADRRPRVTRVWNSAWRTGRHYHQTGILAAARDLVLRSVGPQFLLSRNDWIYRWTP